MSYIKSKKKIIVFFIIFLLSFNIVADYKIKEAQAFDFVVTPTMLWALGTLVTATGIVALNQEQIVDMGSRVWERVKEKNIENGIVILKNGIAAGLKINSTLKDAVAWVAENLPTERTANISNVVGSNSYTFSPDFFPGPFTGTYSVDKFYNTMNIVTDYSVTVPEGETATVTIEGAFSSGTYRLHSGINTFRVMSYYNSKHSSGVPRWCVYIWEPSSQYTCGYSWKAYATSTFFPSDFTITFPDNVYNIVQGVYDYIPYDNTKVRENYTDDKLPVSLPYTDDVPGYISIPSDSALDIPISQDLPLDWDTAKEIIKPIPLDEANDIPGETDIPGEIDFPLDDIFDNTTTKTIDFSPLYFSFKDKFPFSIPFDVYNIVKQFETEKKEPIFYVDMSGFSSGESVEAGFTIDLTKFEVLFSIARFFILVSFVVILALKTRDIIKG